MTSTWEGLAAAARWSGVVSFIRQWLGPFDSGAGMAAQELDVALRANALTLPAAVREWYLLAAKWNPRSLNAWVRPQDLVASDEMVWLLGDAYGGDACWGVRVADLDAEDPPVYSLMEDRDEAAFASFSAFVAAMIVNDVIFDPEAEPPAELDAGSIHAELMCLAATGCDDFYADAALESAAVVAFAYSATGPVFGRARTPAGHALLQRLK
jgi:hypothetical protein